MTDHYSTLGVAESATDDEIKKAFRSLAMQHHPDRNPGDKAAEDKFKAINEAYATLSDPNKRAEYDNIRKFGGRSHGFNTGPHGHHEFRFDFGGDPGFGNVDDIIRQFFNQHGFGGNPFGSQQPRRNRDLQFSVEIPLEDAFSGKDLPLSFDIAGNPTNIVVRIPSGVISGTRMRFQGYGDKSIPNIPPGDLFVIVNVLNHPVFNRDGPHLLSEMKIDALDAIIGCSCAINCIDGSQIMLTIPPGTQNGATMRVSSKGMPSHHNSPNRGDLMVTILITIPKNLSDSHLNALKQIVNERK